MITSVETLYVFNSLRFGRFIRDDHQDRVNHVNFPFNKFGEGCENYRVWSLKGKSSGTGSQSKRRNNKGGAVTESGKRNGRRTEDVEGQIGEGGGEEGRRGRENQNELRDARNKLQEGE